MVCGTDHSPKTSFIVPVFLLLTALPLVLHPACGFPELPAALELVPSPVSLLSCLLLATELSQRLSM